MTPAELAELLRAALRDGMDLVTALDVAGYDLVEKAAWQQVHLDWRGFRQLYEGATMARVPHHFCQHCTGSGVKQYGSTATWRGGIGGQAFTSDVCDICWGSGDDKAPWPSHRKFYGMERRLKDARDAARVARNNAFEAAANIVEAYALAENIPDMVRSIRGLRDLS